MCPALCRSPTTNGRRTRGASGTPGLGPASPRGGARGPSAPRPRACGPPGSGSGVRRAERWREGCPSRAPGASPRVCRAAWIAPTGASIGSGPWRRRAARDVPPRVAPARSRFSAAPASAIGSTGRIYRAGVTRAPLTARRARRYGWRHDRGRTRHRADRARPHRAGRSRADPDARAPAVRHPPSLAAQAGRPRARAGARQRVGDQLRDGQGRRAQLPARRARRGRGRGAPHGGRGRAERGRSLVRWAQPRSARPRRDRPRERRARDHGLRSLCRGVPGPGQRHPDHRGSRRGDGRVGDRRRLGHRRPRGDHRRDRLPGPVDAAGAARDAGRGPRSPTSRRRWPTSSG